MAKTPMPRSRRYARSDIPCLMVMPNVRWRSEVRSITNAEVALMESAQGNAWTKRGECSMGLLDSR